MHYMIESVIASSECTTLKHVVPGKHVLNVLFLVTLTFNQADVLKLTGLLVHMVLFTSVLVSWLVLTGLFRLV